MASGNKGMTMAKRDRENKLRERRLEKQAKKAARALAPPTDELGVGQAAPGGIDAADRDAPAGESQTADPALDA